MSDYDSDSDVEDTDEYDDDADALEPAYVLGDTSERVDRVGRELGPEYDDIPLEKARKCDTYENLMTPDAQARLRDEVPFAGSHLLAPVVSFVMLISGFVSNVAFHENVFVREIQLSDRILHVSSNFGTRTYHGYLFPEKPIKTNRGRKARVPRAGKQRRKIGDGGDMNTQVCIWVRRESSPIDGEVVPASASVFKIKLFRTGDLQLTGSNQRTFTEGINCCIELVDMLNRVLHRAPGAPTSRIAYMLPMLKNYTTHIRMPPQTKLHLLNLHRMLDRIREYDSTGSLRLCGDALDLAEHPSNAPAHPQIKTISYNMQQSRVMITFNTQLPWRQHKNLNMSLFVSGAITIIGALLCEHTSQACHLLHWVLETNHAAVIVTPGRIQLARNVPLDWINTLVRAEFERVAMLRRRRTAADVLADYPNAPPHTVAACLRMWSWQKKHFPCQSQDSDELATV